MDVGGGSSDDDIFHCIGEWNKREVQLANLLPFVVIMNWANEGLQLMRKVVVWERRGRSSSMKRDACWRR